MFGIFGHKWPNAVRVCEGQKNFAYVFLLQPMRRSQKKYFKMDKPRKGCNKKGRKQNAFAPRSHEKQKSICSFVSKKYQTCLIFYIRATIDRIH